MTGFCHFEALPHHNTTCVVHFPPRPPQRSLVMYRYTMVVYTRCALPPSVHRATSSGWTCGGVSTVVKPPPTPKVPWGVQKISSEFLHNDHTDQVLWRSRCVCIVLRHVSEVILLIWKSLGHRPKWPPTVLVTIHAVLGHVRVNNLSPFAQKIWPRHTFEVVSMSPSRLVQPIFMIRGEVVGWSQMVRWCVWCVCSWC